MAYVAFDLDNTLGFFELTNSFAFLWSPDFLENPEQSAPNAQLEISSTLNKKLTKARETFAAELLKDPQLLSTVLRTNLDDMILPLLKADVKGVIIYSNTGVTYSMELAKYLIEHKYNCPGFIKLMADHWHPLRVADRPRYVPEGRYVQPEKTIKTLQLLFRSATGVAPPPSDILFVDDRTPKHKLEAQEAEGLTYIVPKAFYPTISNDQRRRILFVAFESLQRCGVFNEEYMASGFCNRNIPYHHTKKLKIDGFPALLGFVWKQVLGIENHVWTEDKDLIAEFTTYLKKVKAHTNSAHDSE